MEGGGGGGQGDGWERRLKIGAEISCDVSVSSSS